MRTTWLCPCNMRRVSWQGSLLSVWRLAMAAVARARRGASRVPPPAGKASRLLCSASWAHRCCRSQMRPLRAGACAARCARACATTFASVEPASAEPASAARRPRSRGRRAWPTTTGITGASECAARRSEARRPPELCRTDGGGGGQVWREAGEGQPVPSQLLQVQPAGLPGEEDRGAEPCHGAHLLCEQQGACARPAAPDEHSKCLAVNWVCAPGAGDAQPCKARSGPGARRRHSEAARAGGKGDRARA